MQSDDHGVPLDVLGEALFARSRDALLLVDDDGAIVAANPGLCALTGRDAAALHGRPLAALLHEAADDDRRALALAMAGGAAGERCELSVGTAGDRACRVQLHSIELRGRRDLRLLVITPIAAPASRPEQTASEMAVDAAKVGVYRYDLITQRIFYNEHGWAQAQMAPRPDGIPAAELNVIHPDDLPAVRAAGERALATGEPVDVQGRYLLPDGRVRYLLSRRVAQRDADGRPLALFGVVLDVTQQVEQAGRALMLGRRLDSLCTALGIGVWSQDGDGRSEWNAQMWAIYGLPVQPGPPGFEAWLQACVHPEDRDALRTRGLAFAHSDEPVIEAEYRIVRPDGGLRRVAISARREQRGAFGRSTVFGIARDVTEQRAADSALREANERVALAARAVGLGTWKHDFDSDQRLWDENMYRLRGLPPLVMVPAEAARMSWVHPDDRARVQRMHDEVARTREPRAYEFRVIWPDGTQRSLAARTTPLLDAAGRVSSLLGVNWDVTEARAAQQALLARDAAERENRAKSRFLARMSHELRTPLNAVLGFTQLVAADIRDERHRTQLEHVRLAGEHLLSLINDALDLARLQADELSLSIESVEVATLVDEVVTLAQPLARAGGIAVEIESAAGTARADRVRLRQVLINLLSNAVKYNHRGGRVTIAGRTMNGRVIVEVRDSGTGMTPAQLERLFEPFNRLGAEAGGIEGTGIGLAIVKGLVERMNGRIEARSEPGAGSVFTLDLPAVEHGAPASAARPRPPEAAARMTHAGRLLYIEDNPVNVMLVAEMLKQYTRLEFAAAGDGASGVARAKELQPHLVLIDMQLPDFDGFEVLRRLRSEPATARVPCIALSANALNADIERARAAGFDDYWTKPIDLRGFLRSLDAIFGARQVI